MHIERKRWKRKRKAYFGKAYTLLFSLNVTLQPERAMYAQSGRQTETFHHISFFII